MNTVETLPLDESYKVALKIYWARLKLFCSVVACGGVVLGVLAFAIATRSWQIVVVFVNIGLGFAFVIRVLGSLRQNVYQISCLFISYECIRGLFVFLPLSGIQHRSIELVFSAVGYIITLWNMRALLISMLQNLPGVLRFSQSLLMWTFSTSALISITSVKVWMTTMGRKSTVIDWASFAGVLDYVIALAVVLMMVAIGGFTTWFPVRMPRNIVVLSSTFAIYMCSRVFLFLAMQFGVIRPSLAREIDIFVITGCLASWLAFITRQGGTATLRPWQGYHDRERQGLVRKWVMKLVGCPPYA